MIRRLAASAVALACLAASSLDAQPTPFTWPTATPSAVGLNSAVLDSLDAEITAGKYGNIDRMLVIRRDRIVMDTRSPRDYDYVRFRHGSFGRQSRTPPPRCAISPLPAHRDDHSAAGAAGSRVTVKPCSHPWNRELGLRSRSGT